MTSETNAEPDVVEMPVDAHGYAIGNAMHLLEGTSDVPLDPQTGFPFTEDREAIEESRSESEATRRLGLPFVSPPGMPAMQPGWFGPEGIQHWTRPCSS